MLAALEHRFGRSGVSLPGHRRPTTARWALLGTAVLCVGALALSPLGGATRTLVGLADPAPTASSAAATAHSPATDAKATVPPALQQAIHRTLGPGPIGLGTTPAAGITHAVGGFAAQTHGLSLSIARSGSVQVSDGGAHTSSLFARSLTVTGQARLLPAGSSRLAQGTLAQHEGPVTTTYRTTSAGVEQRFTIAAPAGAGAAPRAHTLDLDLGPARGWTVAPGGTVLVPSTPNVSLRYGGLRTTDATGAVVPSHFAVHDGRAEIVVHTTATTRFPLTVDPTWSTTSTPKATLVVPNGATRQAFGYSVALSADGTTALVGAQGVSTFTGAAYVFQATSQGSWATTATPVATLTSSTSNPNGDFGNSVALSADGTTALIGATCVSTCTGAAYVFHATSEASWTTSSTPTAIFNGAGTGNYFGITVALSADGTTALVGSDGVGTTTGAASVFHVASDATWAALSTPATPTAILTDSADTRDNYFGFSVALSADGTTALVGAGGVNAETGAADVFHTTSVGSWTTTATPTATLADPTDTATSDFGFSVALSADGTAALVGATCVNTCTGTAYLFQATSEAAWTTSSTPTATLTDSTDVATSDFGDSVALSATGTTALVGAPGVATTTGAAYVFHATSEASWTTSSTPTATLTDSTDTATTGFGYVHALSADGTTAVIGLENENTSTTAAYLFQVSPPGAPIQGTPVAGNDQVSVTWSAPTAGGADVTGYDVYVGTTPGGEDYSSPACTTASTSCGVSSLADGTTYYFTVEATSAVGNSAPSNETSAVPVAPTVPVVPVATAGYWEVASDGGLFAFTAPFYGSMGGQHLNKPVVGMADDVATGGYWEVASDGGIFSFTAPFYGSMGGQHVNAPIVGMAALPTGMGYYEVAADGGIFAFGTAVFHGSMGAKPLDSPVVGMAYDPTTDGYWEVASDGGIFSFTAPFQGSMGGKPLNNPVVGMAYDPTTDGYWEVASDGGIFSFTAPFKGSMGGKPLNNPVVGMAYDPTTDGYWEVASDGGIFSFTAPFKGSMGGKPLNNPVVGMAASG